MTAAGIGAIFSGGAGITVMIACTANATFEEETCFERHGCVGKPPTPFGPGFFCRSGDICSQPCRGDWCTAPDPVLAGMECGWARLAGRDELVCVDFEEGGCTDLCFDGCPSGMFCVEDMQDDCGQVCRGYC
jgi:hypothetical protein